MDEECFMVGGIKCKNVLLSGWMLTVCVCVCVCVCVRARAPMQLHNNLTSCFWSCKFISIDFQLRLKKTTKKPTNHSVPMWFSLFPPHHESGDNNLLMCVSLGFPHGLAVKAQQ